MAPLPPAAPGAAHRPRFAPAFGLQIGKGEQVGSSRLKRAGEPLPVVKVNLLLSKTSSRNQVAESYEVS